MPVGRWRRGRNELLDAEAQACLGCACSFSTVLLTALRNFQRP